MKEYPVYLFTGFLDDGKTCFVNETLSDESFKIDGTTLLIMCEEGETDLRENAFVSKTSIEYFQDISELTEEALGALVEKHNPIRIIIEYNGMWEISALYDAMPKDWFIFQYICVANAETYPAYLINMRKLCFDKLQDTEVIMFNRCSESTDKAMLRTAVRSINRKADIVYENIDGSIDTDDTPFELPYDKAASEISVSDKDFGIFYLDIMETPKDYEGKTISLKAYVCQTDMADNDCFVAGRFAMACCADDISFIGILCEGVNAHTLPHRSWINITAKVELRTHEKLYGGLGPWLVNATFASTEKPERELITFN